MINIYNQMLEKFSKNGCSLYTLYMILQLNWGIKVDNKFIIDTLQLAEKEKKWSQSWGAHYADIYKWFVDKIRVRTGITISVIALDIKGNKFKDMAEQGFAFGLGLKKAGKNYKQATGDGIITEQELSLLLSDADYGHNHTYCNGYLYDTLGTLPNQKNKLDYVTLCKAVDKGLYYPTARTLYMQDTRLEYWLKAYMNNDGIIHQDVSGLSIEDRKIMERASQLRNFKK